MASDRTRRVFGVIQVVSLGLWCGGAVFFSFVAAPLIFGFLRDKLPANPPPGLLGLTTEVGRRLAGSTVGGIFPAYFLIQIVLGALAAMASAMLARDAPRGGMFCYFIVLAALVLVTLHKYTVYPQSVRVLAEHYAAKESGDEAKAVELWRTFGAWHGASQALNLTTIVLVFAALVTAAANSTAPR